MVWIRVEGRQWPFLTAPFQSLTFLQFSRTFLENTPSFSFFVPSIIFAFFLSPSPSLDVT